MLEVTIDKLPGGDATRRHTLVRIQLTNTGEGVGGVKTYMVQVPQVATDRVAEVTVTTCLTYRQDGEGVLRLLHRTIGQLLGDDGTDTA